jgi:hypothetical protein
VSRVNDLFSGLTTTYSPRALNSGDHAIYAHGEKGARGCALERSGSGSTPTQGKVQNIERKGDQAPWIRRMRPSADTTHLLLFHSTSPRLSRYVAICPSTT